MSIFYIGAFPPKWGGVTVKNYDLYNALIERNFCIKKVDLSRIKRKKSLSEAMKLIGALAGRHNRYIIGVSAASRKALTRLMYFMNKGAMHQSIMIVMGGTAARDISSDPDYMMWMSEFKRIYVETKGMAELLAECGMKNVSIYPNCRRKAGSSFRIKAPSWRLQCVFFSTIQKEKGVGIIIESARVIPEVDFSFYGPIDNSYREEFDKNIESLSNCFYKGIFKGTDESKYRELAGYDVLLLPTQWTTEGVPGVLVEAKIAGLACIVSDVSYNSEIIEHNRNGIILGQNSEEYLTDAICSLKNDRTLLESMKRESHNSANDFYIEKYIDGIIRDIQK